MSHYRYAFEEPGRFARGWHIVMFSQELAVGQVEPLHYFGRELAIYRGDDGEVAILDAYCPHLGAHLAGTGGTVIGSTLRCPFHGWRFDATGRCVEIPYASKIPPRAESALTGWPVCEINGFIAMWYDPDGRGMPTWQLPPIEAWNTPECGDWRFKRKRIRTQGREIVENIVDNAHFAFVHGGNVVKFDIDFTDHTVTQYSVVQQNPDAVFIQPRDVPFDLTQMREQRSTGRHEGHATYHGPAIMYFYTCQEHPDYAYDAWWVNYYTPVNAEEVDLASGVLIRARDDRPLPAELVEYYPDIAYAAFSQDIEIWETKIYRNDPILCDGDGPINKLRKWYDQFYQPA